MNTPAQAQASFERNIRDRKALCGRIDTIENDLDRIDRAPWSLYNAMRREYLLEELATLEAQRDGKAGPVMATQAQFHRQMAAARRMAAQPLFLARVAEWCAADGKVPASRVAGVAFAATLRCLEAGGYQATDDQIIDAIAADHRLFG